MKKKKWFVITLIVFFITRAYILKFPPPFYSDVFHDYRRYANMWHSGLIPYLKHFYEYPPATLPLLYIPLLIKNLGLGHYYQNYRFQIFLFDFILFLFIFKAINKLKTSSLSKKLALGFYLLTPVIAKDFFYEGLDLVFIGSLSIAIISFLLFKKKQFLKRCFFYSFFWLSTSIKLMSAPLLAPYFFLKKLTLKQEIKAFAIGFLLIWFIPLAIFRSSLSVMFVFHANRGIKYASFPGYIVETINYFTQSETRINQPPDFQLTGPVSDIALSIVDKTFYLSIALVLAYAFYIIFKNKNIDYYKFSLKIALIYIFTIFLTGKIFSQPFHLWYIPLIALFPFKSIKTQLVYILLGVWMLILDTTPWITINEMAMFINPLPWKFATYSLRFLPMIVLLKMSFKLSIKNK